ncbi:MAG: ribonuclease III [Symplocastrum torsivum CPER-KK1]|jgi:ribonuclease-3|uniref:Ribonuclease 3 n=1 Tax=Symplocastrum torsivum CPER-KK1 TaxID=450513 RepID=A0A951PFW1_9CYAN|nr:ribonuclease III [Symplocastrum torsivum CPER-KK1]
MKLIKDQRNDLKNIVSLYWDCQNVKITPERAEFLLDFANEQGHLVRQKAYSNWQRENRTYAKLLSSIGFQRINVSSTAKNSVDNKLIVDCIEEVYSIEAADTFIIASGDGDFTSLGHVLKNRGKKVIIFAQQGGVSQSLLDIADESHIIERLDEVPKLPPFRNPSYLEQALNHSSYINENPSAGEDNERLEFLGDAVLNFLSGAFLYNFSPELKMNEAQLTRLRSMLVDEKQLAKFAKELNLGRRIRLGNGAIKEGGRKNVSLLSDIFEAVVGAYFLDSGIEAVRTLVEPLFNSVVKDIVTPQSDISSDILDPKSRFQQLVLANLDPTPPKYITDRSGGTDNAPEFTSKVFVGEKEWGEGKGRSKKDAEKAAAEAALVNAKKRGLV